MFVLVGEKFRNRKEKPKTKPKTQKAQNPAKTRPKSTQHRPTPLSPPLGPHPTARAGPTLAPPPSLARPASPSLRSGPASALSPLAAPRLPLPAASPAPHARAVPFLPHPPRALNGNHRDFRRGPAKHASPRSPACPLLAPPRPQPCILSTHAPPREPLAAPLTPAEPRLCSATAAPPLLRRSPGRTARRLRLDARVFPEPFPSAATHTDPGSTSLRELHRRATAGRRRRAPYAGHLLQYTAR